MERLLSNPERAASSHDAAIAAWPAASDALSESVTVEGVVTATAVEMAACSVKTLVSTARSYRFFQWDRSCRT